MPRLVSNGLTKTKVDHARVPGRYNDGRGLYLYVSAGQGRSWVLRYMRQGKEHAIGLGSAHDIDLEAARQRAASLRIAIRDGADPANDRAAARIHAAIERASAKTFRQCAEAFLLENEPTWANEKHRHQWRSTLATYVYPEIGNLPVAKVDTPSVLKIVNPIWATKNETASRIIGRIASVLDWAKAHGHRTGDNPALWRGHLDKVLPARSRVSSVEHFASLPHANLPALMRQLRSQTTISARALEIVILTASRTKEVRLAQWDEIDLENAVWKRPAAHMKGKKEHRVPLSPEAVAIFKELREVQTGDIIFPGNKLDRPMSDATMSALLERMGHSDITVHGFRSTFRDWVSERTAYTSELAEKALSHVVKNKVEAAYFRSDLFENRRPLMADWAAFTMSGQ